MKLQGAVRISVADMAAIMVAVSAAFKWLSSGLGLRVAHVALHFKTISS
jgi:hypothetical protein